MFVVKVKIIESIKNIEKHEWNSIVGNDNIQVCYDYLNAVESSSISDYEYYYFLVYEKNELIASLPAFITNEFCLDTPLVGTIKQKCEAVRRFLPSFLKQRVLFCGCCIAEYNTFSIKEGANSKKVVEILLEEIEKLSKAKKTKLVIFKDFIKINSDIRKALESSKYFGVYSLPSTFVEVGWDSFEIYLQNLKKKYRQNIRNKINQSSKSGAVEYEVLDNYDDISNELLDLYENTYLKAQVKFEKLEKDFFINLNNHMDNKTSVIVAKKDGKIIGFMLLVNSHDSCVNVRMGMDYECAHDHHLYYMLLYKNIDYAIQRNMKKLYLSQTTYRPKLELGAQLISLMGFIKHRNPVLNKIYKFLFNKLFKKYEMLANSENPHEDLKDLFPHYFNNSSGDRKISA